MDNEDAMLAQARQTLDDAVDEAVGDNYYTREEAPNLWDKARAIRRMAREHAERMWWRAAIRKFLGH